MSPPREHPLVRLIWKIETWQGRFSLPVGRGLGGVLFYGRPLLSNLWNVVMQALVREPAMRFHCASIGTGLRLHGPAPAIMGRGRIDIGNHVEIVAPCSMVIGIDAPFPAQLRIGDHVTIGAYSILCAARGIAIGDHCRIGPFVSIYDTDVHPRDVQLRRRPYAPMDTVGSAPITIAEDAWLGVGAIILKGVHIGRGAIVGAGAVVTRDVPALAIAAGNPARVIGHAEQRTAVEENGSGPRSASAQG
jgi:acetyltransferase-like isoleucine patch superfamily enzyme